MRITIHTVAGSLDVEYTHAILCIRLTLNSFILLSAFFATFIPKLEDKPNTQYDDEEAIIINIIQM